jgi:hypothetical protein
MLERRSKRTLRDRIRRGPCCLRPALAFKFLAYDVVRMCQLTVHGKLRKATSSLDATGRTVSP